MSSEMDVLRDLNMEIAAKESEGDKNYFRALLAPEFAMRRANGEFHNREKFIDAVETSPERRTDNISGIIYGTSAVVTCSVLFPPGSQAQRIHNLRLFTRSDTGASWRLLAWSNEMLP